MRACTWILLVAVAARPAAAQDTRTLDPYNPHLRFEVLAGGGRRTTIVLAAVRRELGASPYSVSGTFGWVANRPNPHLVNVNGGSNPNYWYAYWTKTSQQAFMMLGPAIDGTIPFGVFRLEPRFGFGLIPWAHGTHEGTNGTRCDWTFGGGTQTCGPAADTTLANATETGAYWMMGLGLRRGNLLLYSNFIAVDKAQQAIQGERRYGPLMIGVRF